MSLLTYLSRQLQYIALRLRYGLINILLRRLVSYHRRTLDLSNVTPLSITGPPGSKQRIKLYLHAPPSPPSSSSSSPTGAKGKRPVHINIHGGGFALDLHGIEARWCQYVSHSTQSWVVDADYRRSPAHPFPAAWEDLHRVLSWVRANEGGLFDTERITIGGFSAGGNLALAVTATAEQGVIKGVVAFYPSVDFTIPYPEKRAPRVTKLKGRDKGTVITPRDGQRFRTAYQLALPRPLTRSVLADPRLSPRFAPAEKFPDKGRTFLLACEYDYLLAETEEFARELKEKGREPVYVLAEGVGHGWDGMCRDGTPEAALRDEMWEKAVEVIRRAHGGGE